MIIERIVTGDQMKALDAYTMQEAGLPSLVLMERAGLAVFHAMQNAGLPLQKVLVLCGSGNNGADGIVIARLLHLAGRRVSVCILGKPEYFTEEMQKQVDIGKKYGISFVKTFQTHEYTTIVDAVFGVGLSRHVAGVYRQAIEAVNASECQVVSVDIPSGIHADTGVVMGAAVQADLTVTFAYKKAGICFYPGAAYAGSVVLADIGIYAPQAYPFSPDLKAMTEEDLLEIRRKPEGNKGSFGKIFLIAGSREIFGAACLCGRAAMKTGAGMLKICTHRENRILSPSFLEAMFSYYDEASDLESLVQEGIAWADVIGIGPGLGQSEIAAKLLLEVLKQGNQPLVIDADGLNLLKGYQEFLKTYPKEVILTPHLGEFARLTGYSIEAWKNQPLDVTQEAAKAFSSMFVCKDARTVVSTKKELWVNLNGNDGMATAGSGDVLTGILLGLLAQKIPAKRAAPLGVYLHGAAGDLAARRKGRAGMLAGDILEAVAELLGNL